MKKSILYSLCTTSAVALSFIAPTYAASAEQTAIQEESLEDAAESILIDLLSVGSDPEQDSEAKAPVSATGFIKLDPSGSYIEKPTPEMTAVLTPPTPEPEPEPVDSQVEPAIKLREPAKPAPKPLVVESAPAPVEAKPEPKPAAAPAPVVAKPEPKPAPAPAPAPVVAKPEPKPAATPAPTPAPVVAKPEPKPAPAPAPVVAKPEPKPAPAPAATPAVKLTPAKAITKPAPAPATTPAIKLTPAKAIAKPKPAPAPAPVASLVLVASNDTLADIVAKEIAAKGPRADLNHIDVSQVTNMSGLFKDSNFNGDISLWNVGRVVDMSHMFENSVFNGDISDWDVSKVVNMANMFFRSQLRSEISRWDVSRVMNMNLMFAHAAFDGDISDWEISPDTSKVGMLDESQINNNIIAIVPPNGQLPPWVEVDEPSRASQRNRGEVCDARKTVPRGPGCGKMRNCPMAQKIAQLGNDHKIYGIGLHYFIFAGLALAALLFIHCLYGMIVRRTVRIYFKEKARYISKLEKRVEKERESQS